MTKLLNFGFILVVLFCGMVWEAEAQVSVNSHSKNVKVRSSHIEWGPTIASVKFDNWKQPRTLGDSVIVNISWAAPIDKVEVPTSIFIDGVYTPTPEEVKNRKYRIVLKPKQTTTYKVILVYPKERCGTIIRKIVVLDKNGIEIKEKNKEENKSIKKK